MKHELVIILSAGGPKGQEIARTIRGLQVFCEVLNNEAEIERINAKNPKAIITTGDFDRDRQDLRGLGVPIFNAESADEDKIRGFLFDECGLKGDWDMEVVANNLIEEIKAKVGDKKVLCALSGGVDSTVAAILVHKACGKNLSCIFVDHGLMRLDEGDQIEEIFTKEFDINFIRANVQDRFLGKLKGVVDPEEKRKIVGEEFIRVFEEEGKKLGAINFLVQGTIYPDVIESGKEGAALIKSHHNVGGLPDVIDFEEILEPLRDLFKEEVRKVGIALGIRKELVFRQPFPGPGLAVRVIGEITREKLDILRQTDYIYRDEIAKAGLDTQIWQYFTVFTGVKSTGIKNGVRNYGYTIALRAVESIDAMTANWSRIPYDVLEAISLRMVSEVAEVNRVVYDITGKPPGTIEWE